MLIPSEALDTRCCSFPRLQFSRTPRRKSASRSHSSTIAETFHRAKPTRRGNPALCVCVFQSETRKTVGVARDSRPHVVVIAVVVASSSSSSSTERRRVRAQVVGESNHVSFLRIDTSDRALQPAILIIIRDRLCP